MVGAVNEEPPSLDMLRKLQLFRTTLVNFLGMRNFGELITGCYVRVLLEMRNEDNRRDSNDHYYIASVKGAVTGPNYSGFSSDAATTEWHVVIDLPPCFRSTPNGNVVQLNSISNAPFRSSEYQNWVEMTARTSWLHFPSLPQLQFRLGMLEEHKQQALSLEPFRRIANEDPRTVAVRDHLIAEKRARLEREVNENYLQAPLVDQLKQASLENLQELEREVLDLTTAVRVLINERSKCILCRNRVCTEICYPCKHQVLCKHCAEHINGRCPVPGCNTPVKQTFEPYSS